MMSERPMHAPRTRTTADPKDNNQRAATQGKRQQHPNPNFNLRYNGICAVPATNWHAPTLRVPAHGCSCPRPPYVLLTTPLFRAILSCRQYSRSRRRMYRAHRIRQQRTCDILLGATYFRPRHSPVRLLLHPHLVRAAAGPACALRGQSCD
jgi:hypothetical protein